jgi:hypothetical protein
MKCGKVEKGLKCHGWVMGHGWESHGGTWMMGAWGRNIAPESLHVLVGGMFRGLSYPSIETCVGPPVGTWHVSMGARFWISGFEGYVLKHAIFKRPKLRLPPKHDMFLCWFAQDPHCPCVKTCVGPPQNEYTFTTCRWNNIGAYIPIMTCQRFCSVVVEIFKSIRFPPMLVAGVSFLFFFLFGSLLLCSHTNKHPWEGLARFGYMRGRTVKVLVFGDLATISWPTRAGALNLVNPIQKPCFFAKCFQNLKEKPL